MPAGTVARHTWVKMPTRAHVAVPEHMRRGLALSIPQRQQFGPRSGPRTSGCLTSHEMLSPVVWITLCIDGRIFTCSIGWIRHLVALLIKQASANLLILGCILKDRQYQASKCLFSHRTIRDCEWFASRECGVRANHVRIQYQVELAYRRRRCRDSPFEVCHAGVWAPAAAPSIKGERL